MSTVEERGARVFDYVFGKGHAEASYDLVPLVDEGWDPRPVIELLQSDDEAPARTAAFVLSECAPGAISPYVDAVARAAQHQSAAVRSLIAEALVRQPHGLRFAESSLVRFPTSYGWLDVRTFALLGAMDADAALAAVLRQPEYADTYTAGSVTHAPAMHGPFKLDAVSPKCFRVTTAEDALAAVPRASGLELTSAEIAGLTQAWLAADGVDVTWLQLALPEAAQHDFGWVLSAFAEAIAIDLERRLLTVLVLGSD